MTAAEHHASLTIPTPYRILGQVLEPFCIGHALLFARLDIEEIRTAEQLILAVSVCCEKPSAFPKRLARWSNRVEWAIWGFRCRRLLRHPEELLPRISLFGSYLQEHSALPDNELPGDTEPSESRIPFLQWLRVFLISKLHYQPVQVIDTPYRQAVWDYWTFLEQEGRMEVLDGDAGDMARIMTEKANQFAAQLAKRNGIID